VKIPRPRIGALCICVLSIYWASVARADITTAFSEPVPSTDLSTQPVSPTLSPEAPPWRFTLADWFSPEYHGLENTRGNSVVFRIYVPWSIGPVGQLSRISIPFNTSSASSSSDSIDGDITNTPEGPNGLGDITFYDLSQLNTQCGQFTIGPEFTFPTGSRSGVGDGKWTAGPAGGFSTRLGDWKLGAFTQGFFSFAGDPNQRSVSKLKVQPIINLSLQHGWEIGASEMNFTYDWIKGRLTNIPLGFEIGRSFELYSQKLKFSGELEYNFGHTSGTSAWTLRFTLEYLTR
jgi:hypothetical protein